MKTSPYHPEHIFVTNVVTFQLFFASPVVYIVFFNAAKVLPIQLPLWGIAALRGFKPEKYALRDFSSADIRHRAHGFINKILKSRFFYVPLQAK